MCSDAGTPQTRWGEYSQIGYCNLNHSKRPKKHNSLIAKLFLSLSSLQAVIVVGAVAAAAASTARTGPVGQKAA